MEKTPREHHFYVAVAKFLFYHPEHGIVSVWDPIRIKEAEQYRLSPLILYGVTVARLPIRWMTFTSVDQPRAFRDVLLEAWRNAEGLRGRPDILRVNRHIAQANPEMFEKMAEIGVQVEVANAKERSLPASLRSAQKFSRDLLRMNNGKDQSLTESIQALCRDAQNDHDFYVKDVHSVVNSRKDKDRIQQWLALPALATAPEWTDDCLDWKPGKWLSSWETSLPPDQPRYFKSIFGGICLLTGEKAPEDIVEDDDFCTDSYYDNLPEIAKNLVACWPNSPAEIAKSAGITLQKLKWFISGKAPLEQNARFDLEELLGIRFDRRTNNYVETGPYVLMAHKSEALKEVYENLSGGGDASPCEIIPDQGAADPSWRYVLIVMYRRPPSIVMAPRGAKITEHLPDLLMNYDGIKPVVREFYQDVVSTCARACHEPAANVREMKDFVNRYEKHWETTKKYLTQTMFRFNF
ncbi:MAG: hypothetical protein D3921_09995 [Candidatus Electrothrix sp. AW1]|nr:hypothetical protein [Candidatus Electrothrix sp. AX1]MCI5182822.1 hypothetical protein [Candidatus Electrothrix gigas]